jgi:hypothetical protein
MELPGPKLTNDPLLRQQYFNNTNVGTLDVLGATFDDTLYYNPLNAGARTFDYFVNKDKGKKYTKKEWADSQYYRDGITVGDDGIHEGAASILAERHDERLSRKMVLDRARSSYSLGAAQLGVGLVGSMLDPLNIASAFVPVMSGARFASLAAKYGTTKARAIRGAAEGAVGAALLEPVVLTAAEVEQDKDYTVMDSLLNVTFGTALGGGLHAVGGKLADKLSRTSPQTREVLTKTSVAQLADDKNVDVEPIAKADATLRDDAPLVAGEGVTAETREEFMIEAKGKRIPDALRPSLVADERPKTLLQFIRANGGIWTQDANIGDVRAIMDKAALSLTNSSRADKRSKKGKVLPGAKTLDEMAEAADEAGYFNNIDEYGTGRASVNDLLDAIAEERQGKKRYSIMETERVEAMRAADELFDEAQAYGIDPKGLTDDELFALLEERRTQFEPSNNVPQDIKDGLTEEEFYELREREIGKETELGNLEDDFINPRFIEKAVADYKDQDFDTLQDELKALEEQIETLRMVDEVPQSFIDDMQEADTLIQRAESFEAATNAAATCIARAVRSV